MIGFSIETRSVPNAWRGSLKLARWSTLHLARPVFRVGRRSFPLGRFEIVLERIERFRDPEAAERSRGSVHPVESAQ